jgi:DNA-binding GntR family transcriptional regulator
VTPDEVARELARAIRERTILPGTQLVQEDLARRFGVSRNPVREALRLLEGEGLVEMRAGGGGTVRSLTAEDLDEVYMLRTALEPSIAPLVIDGATPRAIAALSALAEEMRRTDDVDTWMRSNYDFHRQIHELTGRPRTVRILSGLLSAGQPYSYENVAHLDGRRQAEDEHDAMVAAIRAGDSEVLGATLRKHVSSAHARLSTTRPTPG